MRNWLSGPCRSSLLYYSAKFFFGDKIVNISSREAEEERWREKSIRSEGEISRFKCLIFFIREHSNKFLYEILALCRSWSNKWEKNIFDLRIEPELNIEERPRYSKNVGDSKIRNKTKKIQENLSWSLFGIGYFFCINIWWPRSVLFTGKFLKNYSFTSQISWLARRQKHLIFFLLIDRNKNI